MQHNIYKILFENVERNVISFLEPEEVFKNGLSNKAMVGYLMNPMLPVKPNNIQMNPFFITLFQNVIRATAPTIESFKLAAQEQNEGFIYMIDQRDKNHPNTKTFDIVGAFELHSGKSTAEDYTPNPNYQIISDDGFFQLPEIFYTKILEAMRL